MYKVVIQAYSVIIRDALIRPAHARKIATCLVFLVLNVAAVCCLFAVLPTMARSDVFE